MAILWPRKLFPSIRKDGRRKAEVKVYDKLAQALDDNFHVFYSSTWLATDRFGNERDGECDFLIAHPDYGFLAIEVKGGKEISYDSRLDKWTSRDYHNFVHRIKDPVVQAKNAKHQIFQKLKELKDWKNRRFRMAHGVIFPDVEAPPQNLGADRPAKIFCCSKQLRFDLKNWVCEILNTRRKPDINQRLGKEGIECLKEILVHPFALKSTVGIAIDNDDEEFALLEPTQFIVLNAITDLLRVYVQGAAGTGKTVVAVQEAVTLAKSGRKTLLTCYNRPLAEFLKQKLRKVENLKVDTFHSICRQVAKHASISTADHKECNFLYDSVLPSALYDGMQLKPFLKWDAIIVDEGQDFQMEWWLSVDASLKTNGKLRVFLDSNQTIYKHACAGLKDIEAVPVRLDRNLRNTRKIHEVISHHYKGMPIIAEGPVGENVVWKIAKNTTSKVKIAITELKRLVNSQNVSPSDIAVLANSQDVKNKLIEQTVGIGIPITNAENLVREETVIDTVRRFKGLDRKAVILIVDEAELHRQELAYVAFSRARSYLFIVHSKRDQSWLKKPERHIPAETHVD